MPPVFSKPTTFSAYLTTELAEGLNPAMPQLTNHDLAAKTTTTVFKTISNIKHLAIIGKQQGEAVPVILHSLGECSAPTPEGAHYTNATEQFAIKGLGGIESVEFLQVKANELFKLVSSNKPSNFLLTEILDVERDPKDWNPIEDDGIQLSEIRNFIEVPPVMLKAFLDKQPSTVEEMLSVAAAAFREAIMDDSAYLAIVEKQKALDDEQRSAETSSDSTTIRRRLNNLTFPT